MKETDDKQLSSENWNSSFGLDSSLPFFYIFTLKVQQTFLVDSVINTLKLFQTFLRRDSFWERSGFCEFLFHFLLSLDFWRSWEHACFLFMLGQQQKARKYWKSNKIISGLFIKDVILLDGGRWEARYRRSLVDGWLMEIKISKNSIFTWRILRTSPG